MMKRYLSSKEKLDNNDNKRQKVTTTEVNTIDPPMKEERQDLSFQLDVLHAIRLSEIELIEKVKMRSLEEERLKVLTEWNNQNTILFHVMPRMIDVTCKSCYCCSRKRREVCTHWTGYEFALLWKMRTLCRSMLIYVDTYIHSFIKKYGEMVILAVDRVGENLVPLYFSGKGYGEKKWRETGLKVTITPKGNIKRESILFYTSISEDIRWKRFAHSFLGKKYPVKVLFANRRPLLYQSDIDKEIDIFKKKHRHKLLEEYVLTDCSFHD